MTTDQLATLAVKLMQYGDQFYTLTLLFDV